MTKRAFLERCGSLVSSGRWQVVTTGQIRLKRKEDLRSVSPVAAVGSEILNGTMPEVGQTFLIAERIGLSNSLASRLYQATDIETSRCGLRGELLRAIGV